MSDDFERSLHAVPGLTEWSPTEPVEFDRGVDVYTTRANELLVNGILTLALIVMTVASPAALILLYRSLG